jgi:hypothetical protein
MRALARSLRRVLWGAPPPNPLAKIIEKERDRRFPMFRRAMEFVDYELVAGDILEFGVYTGMSLALFGEAMRLRWDRDIPRRLVGFDSFQGLPTDNDGHARWGAGACATNVSWHPVLATGAPVSAEAVTALFDACALPRPELEVGTYDVALQKVLGSKYKQAALVHIDCDLYEPTRAVLFALDQILQDGSVLLFDDWYHYRADPNKGEARAFSEFIAAHPHWEAIPYFLYGTYSRAFILHRR